MRGNRRAFDVEAVERRQVPGVGLVGRRARRAADSASMRCPQLQLVQRLAHGRPPAWAAWAVVDSRDASAAAFGASRRRQGRPATDASGAMRVTDHRCGGPARRSPTVTAGSASRSSGCWPRGAGHRRGALRVARAGPAPPGAEPVAGCLAPPGARPVRRLRVPHARPAGRTTGGAGHRGAVGVAPSPAARPGCSLRRPRGAARRSSRSAGAALDTVVVRGVPRREAPSSPQYMPVRPAVTVTIRAVPPGHGAAAGPRR